MLMMNRLLISTFFLLMICVSMLAADELDNAEIFHGERLFLEPRFAQFFYEFTKHGGDINSPLEQGDPKLEKTVRFFGLPPYQIPFTASPFKGTSFSCRSCHMVDEHVNQKELGMRAYVDFASRSPLSERNDQQAVTVRNSPVLVTSAISRDNFILHYDGEFASMQELIIATLTGRNLGWLPEEHEIAADHVCEVIRKDDGVGNLAKEFGNLSYTEVFSGRSKSGEQLPEEYLIGETKRFNVARSSCDEILNGIAYLIGEYIVDLKFSKDETSFSPYDLFLIKNGLPTQANDGESDKDYSVRLLSLVQALEKNNKLHFIQKNPYTDDGGFRFHDQVFKFGKQELQGLKIFFNQEITPELSVGNCVSCHPAPHFTDFGLHNIGVTQVEYEAIHGQNSFLNLPIPSRKIRNEKADLYLPATKFNPNRKGLFRQAASETNLMAVDLGAWNIFFNEDFPNPQEKLFNLFCNIENECNNKNHALQKSVATFKTPTLRDLGHSAPYMHNGQISDLHAVIGFYIASSRSSREGRIRNADNELEKIKMTSRDIQPLFSFLVSLYEDYH